MYFCNTRAPNDPANQAYLREWLRQYYPDVYADAKQEYERLRDSGVTVSVDNWSRGLGFLWTLD